MAPQADGTGQRMLVQAAVGFIQPLEEFKHGNTMAWPHCRAGGPMVQERLPWRTDAPQIQALLLPQQFLSWQTLMDNTGPCET